MSLDVEKIIREYIDKTVHMSLATSKGDKPWVCELHFVYDDALNLYWRSKPARRHSSEIENNPNVAGNIVKQHEPYEFPHAIYFEGRAEVLADEGQVKEVYQIFKKLIGLDREVIDEARTKDGHKFYKVTVENWYAFGKFGDDSACKYKLKWNGGKK